MIQYEKWMMIPYVKWLTSNSHIRPGELFLLIRKTRWLSQNTNRDIRAAINRFTKKTKVGLCKPDDDEWANERWQIHRSDALAFGIYAPTTPYQTIKRRLLTNYAAGKVIQHLNRQCIFCGAISGPLVFTVDFSFATRVFERLKEGKEPPHIAYCDSCANLRFERRVKAKEGAKRAAERKEEIERRMMKKEVASLGRLLNDLSRRTCHEGYVRYIKHPRKNARTLEKAR